ncbi:MAG: HAMP domain-containing sensor histidine kinase [Actinomycetota bacterium]
MTTPAPALEPGRHRSLGLAALLLWPLLAAVSLGFVGLGWFVERSVRADLIGDIDAQLVSVAQREAIIPLERGTPAEATPAGAPGRGPGGAGPSAGQPPTPTPDAADGSAADGSAADGSAADGSAGEGGAADGDGAIEPDGDVDGDVPVLGAVEADGVVQVVGPGGDFPLDHPDLQTALTEPGYHTLDGDAPYRLLSIERADGATGFVAISTTPVDELLTGLRRSLLFGALAVFVAEALVVWWVTRRVARPIGAMVDAADSIAHGALDTPIPTASRPAETAQLGLAVAAMVDRLRHNLAAAESSAAEATAARAQMQRFLADASHELRTPLTAIGGYGQLHNRGMLGAADLDQAMLRIERESARLSRLVNDMLQLARSGDETELVSERVDLVAVAHDAVADLAAAMPERDLRVEATVGSAIVQGDPDHLHQAVLNLVTNAVDHGPDDQPVVVRIGAAGGAPTVDVIDRGPGIEPADAERIFEPFYRPASARTRDGEGRRRLSGAGLGLALVRTISERHGATVTHRPTDGGGATFSLAFPSGLAPQPQE